MARGRGRRRAWMATAVATGVLTVAGCIGDTDRADFNREIERRGGGVTTDLLTEPLDELRDELGVDDPELLVLSISPVERIVVLQVRKPSDRRQVDDYVAINGNLRDPEPVQISVTDDLDARTFRRSEIPALGHLEQLSDDAIAALGYADAFVDTIVVNLTDGEPWLRLNVESPRATGSVEFDRNGTLLRAVPG